ncbi:MAG: LacI family transcriptional regulator, partial [Armatimonadota bacterium]|nr:LacI family transcriptional regulator [Armatimonadota bacterium]
MVSMQEIARRAGVSAATVSYVLNDRVRRNSVSEATRQRVLAIAEELGYRRNTLAQAVKTGKNPMLGLLVADRSARHAEFMARLTYGVLDEAEEQDHTIKILRLHEDTQAERTIERCAELRLSGLIALEVGDEMLHRLRHHRLTENIPLVILDRSSYGESDVLRVRSDDAAGCRAAVAHLHELGHRRIAFLGGERAFAHVCQREAGYRSGLADYGLKVPRGFVRYGDWSIEGAHRALDEWLAFAAPPTAVMCASDWVAWAVLGHAQQRGVAVPGHLSVVGFADLSFTEFTTPPLTTVAQPFEIMGRAAARLLLSHIHDESIALDICESVSTHLIVRESTAPPASLTT